ncbi:MAG TPA: glycosyltransferase N-terminal domain-containing protein [Chitinophagales bacterium]|nr:glycosyltransferase N-terminal domain-containing protein [Chitinophagales bacterium]
MQVLSLVVYNLSVRLYGMAIWLASPFNKKAAHWVQGRKAQAARLAQLKGDSAKRIWVHCASLGEFEQARPVIEKLQNIYPGYKIVLTFFSPSGYEVRKSYKEVEAVLYLPLDTRSQAKAFIDAIQPQLALFVKYEFWYNYLDVLNEKNIPIVLFSAVFRSEQVFFKWYGGLFRKMLKAFTKIFVQDENSMALLQSIGIGATVANDTRFDRVFEIAANRKEFELIGKFKGGSKLLVAGSTWKTDESLLVKLINEKQLEGYKYLIAPHNLNAERLNVLKGEVNAKALFYSELSEANTEGVEVVIIDNIGMLAALYAYADVAYIGGAFNASVHNVLEAAVYGLPLFFGPNYLKSNEAKDLLERKAAFSISGYAAFAQQIRALLGNLAATEQAKAAAKLYVQQNLGGTNAILKYLENIKLA